MKKIVNLMMAILLLVACSPEAPYSTDGDTVVKIEVKQIKSGYVCVSFTPDRDAYYLVSIDKVVPGLNPHKMERTFMQLALDSAYMTYVTWRYHQMLNGVPAHQVAPFQSHALQYGHTEFYAYYLEPDTEYWIYAFAVNPEANRPTSRLFIHTIRTEGTSSTICRFRYRVKGYWDYVYPLDSLGNLLNDFPYMVGTLDSVEMRRRCIEGGFASPAVFFADSINRVLKEQDMNSRVLWGIYAHNNDGIGDGTSSTLFEEGHTYYTAMAGVDGQLYPGKDQNALFRFTWHENMDTIFSPASSLRWHEW